MKLFCPFEELGQARKHTRKMEGKLRQSGSHALKHVSQTLNDNLIDRTDYRL